VISTVVRRWATLPRPTAWRLFVLLLLVALASEYWDKDALVVGGGLTIPWPRFMLALSLLPLLVAPRDRKWSAIMRLPAPLAPMLVFFGCCAMSILGVALAPSASDPRQFLKTFLHFTTYILFVVVVVKWVTWPRLSLLVRGYYALGIFAALVTVLQYVYGNLGWFPWLAPLRFQSAEYDVGGGLTAGFRASSIFGEPSWAARYYVHFLAVAMAFWVQNRQWPHVGAIVLFLFAFYAANSLLGYVILGSFIVAALVAQLWRKSMFSIGRRHKIVLGVAAYAWLLLWMVGMTPRLPDLIDRSVARVALIQQGAGAVDNRIDSVFAGLQVWKLAPIVGVGLGNIDQYIVRFYQSPEWVLRSQYAADSVYVQILAEAGVVGLIGFLWFWIRLLWFSAPAGFAGTAAPDVSRAYIWMRFLQLDLFAQAVGMSNAADYLNPHLWTVIAIVLACKVLILRSAPLRTTHAPAIAPQAGLPGLAF
jgi:hypothetical protein